MFTKYSCTIIKHSESNNNTNNILETKMQLAYFSELNIFSNYFSNKKRIKMFVETYKNSIISDLIVNDLPNFEISKIILENNINIYSLYVDSKFISNLNKKISLFLYSKDLKKHLPFKNLSITMLSKLNKIVKYFIVFFSLCNTDIERIEFINIYNISLDFVKILYLIENFYFIRFKLKESNVKVLKFSVLNFDNNIYNNLLEFFKNNENNLIHLEKVIICSNINKLCQLDNLSESLLAISKLIELELNFYHEDHQYYNKLLKVIEFSKNLNSLSIKFNAFTFCLCKKFFVVLFNIKNLLTLKLYNIFINIEDIKYAISYLSNNKTLKNLSFSINCKYKKTKSLNYFISYLNISKAFDNLKIYLFNINKYCQKKCLLISLYKNNKSTKVKMHNYL